MKKIITFGTFDLFHEGHRRLLERAKALGDYLIVGVTTERFDIKRGKMNVMDSLTLRIDNVRNSGYVDEVIVEEHEGQKLEEIQKNGADVFAVGSDWKGRFDYLKKYCDVVYLERTRDISSTKVRREHNKIAALGIVGTGRIADRFAVEMKLVSGVFIKGAYNPRGKSAKRFREKHELFFDSSEYDNFLTKLDAVYIASPHGTHYEYARRALLAGKHVLCEKPMVLHEAEAKELFELAAVRNLVLMEAIKTAYMPGFLDIVAIVNSGRLGVVRDVEAAFTKLVPDISGAREYDPVFGGSFTELASYPLFAILKILGCDYQDMRFEFFKNTAGVDVYAKTYFKYDGAVACAKAGIGVKSEGQLLISGTKGYIIVKSPWWRMESFEICCESIDDNESFSVPMRGHGLRYEIADFIRNINNLSVKNFKVSRKDSIALAGIMERFLEARKNG